MLSCQPAALIAGIAELVVQIYFADGTGCKTTEVCVDICSTGLAGLVGVAFATAAVGGLKIGSYPSTVTLTVIRFPAMPWPAGIVYVEEVAPEIALPFAYHW